MQNSKLRELMLKFSNEELKEFLGEDLVDSLIEWENGSDTHFSKSKLVDMILNINGVNILRNKDFRKRLLKSMSQKEIIELGCDMQKADGKDSDCYQIIENISNRNWKDCDVNRRILQTLNYAPNEIFGDDDAEKQYIEKIRPESKFYELLDYQYVIEQRALSILNEKPPLKRFLIHMPTGTGKTKTAMHIIVHHYCFDLRKKGIIIWIAHTDELLEQAYETFVSVWNHIGDGEITIYKMWGDGVKDISDNPNGFMVCGIQKLQSMYKNQHEQFEKLKNNVRLIVYDEAHKAAAEGAMGIVKSLMVMKQGMSDRSLMGLTATPGRSTEMSTDNDVLVSLFGGRIIEIDTNVINQIKLSKQEAVNTIPEKDIIKYFQERKILSKIKKEELEYPITFSNAQLEKIQREAADVGKTDFSREALETIGVNKSRNFRILKRLQELNTQEIPTIVFACSVKQGMLLSSMLTLDDIPNALVYGDMLETDRKKAIDSFKDRESNMNILINYGVLTTGFDATNIQCVFITRPTKSVVLYSQMIGRGLRGLQMGGEEYCLLIDLKDNLGKFDANMAFSHFNSYWN